MKAILLILSLSLAGHLLHGQIYYNPELVDSVTTFSKIGGRMDWHKESGNIVYDQQEEKSCDIFIYYANRDTTLNLTADMNNNTFNGQTVKSWQHRGQPAFHPSGKFIVFQTMNDHASEKYKTPELLSLGVNNDLWVMNLDGSNKKKLTQNPEGFSVLHPHFSHDGKKIIWAEKYNDCKRKSTFGAWRIRIADVEITESNNLTLNNVATIQPGGEKWYETHGFSLDDNKIIFSGNLDTDLKANDIYTYDLENKTLTNLTESPSTWEEMHNYNPSNSSEYSYISSSFFDWKNRWGWATLRTELYINRGGNPHQLTGFNQKMGFGTEELTKKHYFIGDHCYSADGKSILAVLAEVAVGESTSKIIQIHLK